jgi:20S proteasome alpha/beta subunit
LVETLNKDIEVVDADLHESLEPMTTVIGIRCKEGIVLATDSQSSIKRNVEMKRFGVKKIIPIFKVPQPIIYYALAGAGDAKHIRTLAEEISLEIGDRILYDRDLRERVYNVLLQTYRKYNTIRFRSLGSSDTSKRYFEATSLLAARLYGNNSFGLYLLSSDPWIEPIIDYETIGSGAPFANLMLQQLNRGLNSMNKSFHDLPLMFCALYATYIINDVKTVDIRSGGSTKVSVINKNGFTEIPDNILKQLYDEFLGAMSGAFSKLIEDPRISRKAIKDIFPQHQ